MGPGGKPATLRDLHMLNRKSVADVGVKRLMMCRSDESGNSSR